MRQRLRRFPAMRGLVFGRDGHGQRHLHEDGDPERCTPETGTGPARPPALGRYAAIGLLALAGSLAGVMGGHHLLAQVLGPEEADESLASASAREASPECPRAMRALDACDFDTDARSIPSPAPPAPAPVKE